MRLAIPLPCTESQASKEIKKTMKKKRQSGVLMHFFPSWTIRDRIIRSISIWFCWFPHVRTKQRYGKSCRLVQLVMEDSPSFSAFAGNTHHLLIFDLWSSKVCWQKQAKGGLWSDPIISYAKVSNNVVHLAEKKQLQFLKIKVIKRIQNFVKPMLLGWNSSQNTWLLKNTLIWKLGQSGQMQYSCAWTQSFG